MGCESSTTISSVVQAILVLMKKPSIVCFCLTVRLCRKYGYKTETNRQVNRLISGMFQCRCERQKLPFYRFSGMFAVANVLTMYQDAQKRNSQHLSHLLYAC